MTILRMFLSQPALELAHVQPLQEHSYLGIQRSADCVIIQITANDTRTVDQKRALFKAIADNLHQQVGLRREDVFVSLVEVRAENWSFGNGEAQYAPRPI